MVFRVFPYKSPTIKKNGWLGPDVPQIKGQKACGLRAEQLALRGLEPLLPDPMVTDA